MVLGRSLSRLRAPALALAAVGAVSILGISSTGCAQEVAADARAADVSDTVEIASGVVVADPTVINSVEVAADHLRIPLADAAKYQHLPVGTIFVGARGKSTGANPDGFLRRVEAVSVDGDTLVVQTSVATLTDAIVNGGLRASSGGSGSFVEGEADGLSAARPLEGIAIDLSGESLFDNVDTIKAGKREGVFTESIKVEHGVLTAHPSVAVDLRIRDGKVSRFVAKVEGDLDLSVKARAEVTAEGDLDASVLSALKEKRHDSRRVIYASKRIPLPTFAIGRVPISPSVQFTVAIRCDLTFGGPLVADAGVEAKSLVRLGGVYEDGQWSDPIRSEFDIRPSFALEKGSDSTARCALETNAELSAFGESGVTMSVAPYVDFDVQRGATAGEGSHVWHANAGATGAMKGTTPVFGVMELDRDLVEWKTDKPLTGKN